MISSWWRLTYPASAAIMKWKILILYIGEQLTNPRCYRELFQLRSYFWNLVVNEEVLLKLKRGTFNEPRNVAI